MIAESAAKWPQYIRVIRKITNISYYNIVWEYDLYTPFVAFFIKTYFWNFQNGGFGEKFRHHFENFM